MSEALTAVNISPTPATIPVSNTAVRVCYQSEVFLAPLLTLWEEDEGLYQGFGKHARSHFRQASLPRLLQIQRDLRLCIRFQPNEYDFCDLCTQELLTSDPFDVLRTCQELPWWEYIPGEDDWCLVRASVSFERYLALEEALFSPEELA